MQIPQFKSLITPHPTEPSQILNIQPLKHAITNHNELKSQQTTTVIEIDYLASRSTINCIMYTVRRP